MINSEYLNNLNKAQKEAVLHLDGPLLIVAGAGSGKTKVLTSRIAHIIKEKKAFPNQILSVTFTNKAAKEMQSRVSAILNSEAIGLSWLGTFHSICAKLLRKHATAVGLTSNFTIIDTDDQVRLIKNICKSEDIDIKQLAPKYILSIIERINFGANCFMSIFSALHIFLINLTWSSVSMIVKLEVNPAAGACFLNSFAQME